MANRRDYSVFLNGTGTEGPDAMSQQLAFDNPNAKRAWRSSSDFKRHKPAGWIPPTSYEMDEGSWQFPRGDVYGKTFVWEQHGYLPNRSNPLARLEIDQIRLGIPGGFPPHLSNKVVQNVRLKAKDTTFNAAQAFAERAQTADLVSGALRRIAQAARDIRHGNPRRGLERLGDYGDYAVKTLPDAILAFQYGVKPLAQDIYGACAALDKAGIGVKIDTHRSQVKEDYKLTGENVEPSNPGNSHRSHGSVFYGASARLDTVPGNAALQSAASLGLTNPALLAWELLPFSFVVDWAYPLGDYFSQLDGLVGLEVKGFSVSLLTKVRAHWTGIDPFGDRDSRWDSFYRRTSLTRSASMEVPFARLPSLKNPFNSKDHVLNALALLAGAFR